MKTTLTPQALAVDVVATLSQVTTATISTALFKKGLRNVWIRGASALSPDQPRVVGRAFTMRFVPMREDLANPQAWSSPRSTRVAVEQMPAGCIAVVDEDGAIVIPDACLDEVLAAGPQQERLEAWVLKEVQAGAALPGLYPPNPENQARYAKALSCS